jgi:hypothetical protein
MFFFKPARPAAPRPQASRLRLPQARPTLEALETRVVPYAVSGNAWPSPQLVTMSFLPDGTVMAQGCGGPIVSNLFSSFNDIPGVTYSSQWENIVIKAAQMWAQQTNLNFTVIADDGEAIGAGAYQQGNPNFGDVRVGGNVFGYNWLGSTYYPPSANNYSLAGDIAFNTGYAFNIGSTYDLFTVAMHEFGHALGLGNSGSSSAVMYGCYNGAFSSLGSDDIAGIQAVYGSGRAHDAYNSNGHSNGSFATAANISASIEPGSLTAVVTGLDLTTIGQTEYFAFTAPSSSASTMTVSVQSTGLSLLTPKVTVYNASKVAIGSASFHLASGAVQDGATLTLSNLAVTPGATYYIAVGGVDRTSFSTGAYALTLNLGTGPNPTVPLPNTQLANGSPLQSGGGQPQVADTASPPVSAHSADASLLNGVLGHGGEIAVATSQPTANSMAAAVTVPATSSPSVPTHVLPAVLPAGPGGEATTPVAEQLASPAAVDEGNPGGSAAVQPAGADQTPDAPSRDEPWQALAIEAPREEAASVPAVAEAMVSNWTQDGALAAAMALLGGAWVRWHAAHPREDQRRHHPQARKDASR